MGHTETEKQRKLREVQLPLLVRIPYVSET